MSEQQRHPHLPKHLLGRRVVRVPSDEALEFAGEDFAAWEAGLLPGTRDRAYERLEIGGEG